jgi:hypothetical protein
MNDDWISPDHRPAAPAPRLRGEEAWHVTKDGHVISCELRNEERTGAGWDVVIRQGGELSFSRRCADEASARFVAHAMKQDHLNSGWTEQGGA